MGMQQVSAGYGLRNVPKLMDVSDVQTAINQSLLYWEHLSEPMAELLQILSEQYDYPQLTEEVLKDMSRIEFNSNDLKGPKSVSTFLAKVSELTPQSTMKQMSLLANLLDSEVTFLLLQFDHG